MSDKPVCPQHPYAGAVLQMPWRMVCPKCQTFLWWAAPPGLLQKPTCPDCQAQITVRLFRVTASNGHCHIVWYCSSCECYVKDGNRLWLPTAQVAEMLDYWSTRLPERNLPSAIDDLPLLKEHSNGEPCVICGAPGTEYNHFMPQVFKGDPDVAPEWTEWDRLGAWLCDRHHKVWHAKVAPLQMLSQIKREAVK